MKKKPKPIQAELFKEEVDDYLPFVFEDWELEFIERYMKQFIENKNKKNDKV